jgi:adenylate cyclase class IV
MLRAMARNIEIKARINSVESLLARARALADGAPQLIRQHDSFYAVAHGRLKLRRLGDGRAELIHYHRADGLQARASDYQRLPVTDAEAVHRLLERACGGCGEVRKQRWLLLAGRTRIHLDRVEGLGDFMELEVVLAPGDDDAAGAAEAEALMQALGLANAERIAGAYVDRLNSAP